MKNIFSKHKYSVIMCLVLFLVIFFAGCRSASAPPTGNHTQQISLSADLTQSPEFDLIVVPEEPLVPEIKDECFSCHTDQQALIDTAKPVVVIEKENSGEG